MKPAEHLEPGDNLLDGWTLEQAEAWRDEMVELAIAADARRIRAERRVNHLRHRAKAEP